MDILDKYLQMIFAEIFFCIKSILWSFNYFNTVGVFIESKLFIKLLIHGLFYLWLKINIHVYLNSVIYILQRSSNNTQTIGDVDNGNGQWANIESPIQMVHEIW